MTETDKAREIAENPDRVGAFLQQTVATREPSGHPANCLGYARKTRQGIPGGSCSPSIASVHGGPLQPPQPFCLGISQPGRYPDIMAMTRAKAVAARNLQAASLEIQTDFHLPLKYKPERSVAATGTLPTVVVAALARHIGRQKTTLRHLRIVTRTG